MIDVDRLKEAVDQGTVQVEHGMPLMPSVAHDLLAAARLIVEGQPLVWCVTHDSPPFYPELCWNFHFLTIGRSRECRMVEGRWFPLPDKGTT